MSDTQLAQKNPSDRLIYIFAAVWFAIVVAGFVLVHAILATTENPNQGTGIILWMVSLAAQFVALLVGAALVITMLVQWRRGRLSIGAISTGIIPAGLHAYMFASYAF